MGRSFFIPGPDTNEKGPSVESTNRSFYLTRHDLPHRVPRAPRFHISKRWIIASHPRIDSQFPTFFEEEQRTVWA